MSNPRSQITVTQKGIGEILKQFQLKVPPNQRDYSWTGTDHRISRRVHGAVEILVGEDQQDVRLRGCAMKRGRKYAAQGAQKVSPCCTGHRSLLSIVSLPGCGLRKWSGAQRRIFRLRLLGGRVGRGLGAPHERHPLPPVTRYPSGCTAAETGAADRSTCG